MAAVSAMVIWIVVAYLTADPPPTSPAGKPAGTAGRPPVSPQAAITPPPGHEAGDDIPPAPPVRSQEPLLIPPRYDGPPALPVPDVELKAATDRGFEFMELFANSRWDDRADDKVNSLSAFVSGTSLDVVLAQYERVRAKEAKHESVTYRVTSAMWRTMSDEQLGLVLYGERRVVDDSGDRTDTKGFFLNLVKTSDTWNVTSVRDPAEGDQGLGQPRATGEG